MRDLERVDQARQRGRGAGGRGRGRLAWVVGGLLLAGAAHAQAAADGGAAGAGAPAAEAAGPATQALRDAHTRLRQLLERVPAGQKPDPKVARTITDELRSLFDIQDMARRALSAHWATMSAAQRRSITDTLRDVVEQNYLSQLRSNLRYDIRYDGEEARAEGDRLVRTVILAQRRGRPFQVRVDYVLHPQPGGGFRAYDVVTDGVSLLENYRGQFNRIIRRDGVDGLIRRMRSRLERGSAQGVGPDGPAGL